MKNKIILFIMLSLILMLNFAFAEDFYYNGEPQRDLRSGRMVVSLPPPPPLDTVPWYVRDDWDDYSEDYYECILGYKYGGLTCRYWRKYAEKMGYYQNVQNNIILPQGSVPQQNGNALNNGANNIPPMNAPTPPVNQNGYVAPNGQAPSQNNGYVAPSGKFPNETNGYIRK